MARYRLGDIAPIQQGVVPNSNQYWLLNLDMVESNTGKVLDYLFVDDSQIGASTVSFDQSNVLYSKLRPYLNKVVLPDRAGYATSEMLPLKPDEKIIIRDYLAYFLRSPHFVNYINEKTSGAKMPRANTADLKAYEIDCPSIVKQKRIVSQIDSISRIIQARQQQLTSLDDLIKARFVEMFGDPVLNQKGFPVYRMDEVVEFQGGSQPDKKYFEYQPTEDNIRLIQIRDYKTDNYITYIPKAMAKRFCTTEDIMIGRYGPPIFQILQGIEGSFNVALMKATPKMGNREFIRYFLKQDCLLHYLEGMSKRTAGQDGIQMDKLKAYPFPMPPIEAQEEFEGFVIQVDKSKSVIQKSLDETQLLFDKLMQDYFG